MYYAMDNLCDQKCKWYLPISVWNLQHLLEFFRIWFVEYSIHFLL